MEIVFFNSFKKSMFLFPLVLNQFRSILDSGQKQQLDMLYFCNIFVLVYITILIGK